MLAIEVKSKRKKGNTDDENPSENVEESTDAVEGSETHPDQDIGSNIS